MSIVPDTTEDQRKIQYDQEVKELGLQKAKLQGEVEVLHKDVEALDVQRAKVVRETEEAQSKLETLRSNFTKESQYHIELIEGLKKKIGELEQEADRLEKLILSKNEEIQVLQSRIVTLEAEMKQRLDGIMQRINLASEALEDVEAKRINAMGDLTTIEQERDAAVKERDEAKAETEAERIKQNEEREFLGRKARDLAIYENRLRKYFKQAYPDQEMKFI